MGRRYYQQYPENQPPVNRLSEYSLHPINTFADNYGYGDSYRDAQYLRQYASVHPNGNRTMRASDSHRSHFREDELLAPLDDMTPQDLSGRDSYYDTRFSTEEPFLSVTPRHAVSISPMHRHTRPADSLHNTQSGGYVPHDHLEMLRESQDSDRVALSSHSHTPFPEKATEEFYQFSDEETPLVTHVLPPPMLDTPMLNTTYDSMLPPFSGTAQAEEPFTPHFTVNTQLGDVYPYPEVVECGGESHLAPHGYLCPSPAYRFHSQSTTPRTMFHPTAKSVIPLNRTRDADTMRFSSLGVSPRAQNRSFLHYPSTPKARHFASASNTGNSPPTPVNREASSDPYLRLLTLPLWKQAPYQQIWEKGDFAHQIMSGKHIMSHSNDAGYIHQRIDEAIVAKRDCRFAEARAIFVQLVFLFPTNLQVWMEFARLEMECGEYASARDVLDAATTQVPNNESLLQKSLKVEERLGDVDALLGTLRELRSLDTQKSVKTMMDGVKSLVRMGYEKIAFDYYVAVTNNPRYFTGNFFLEFLQFQTYTSNYVETLEQIPNTLRRFPKYGPLWFFCLDVIQHYCFIRWDGVSPSMNTSQLEAVMREALATLSNDILWRVHFIRIQFYLRALLLSREGFFRQVAVQSASDAQTTESSFLRESVVVQKRMIEDVRMSLENCQENLKWKVFTLLGRGACVLGYRNTSLLVGVLLAG